METKDYKRTSKFLSLVLRHKPEEIGITLDKNGWTRVSDLLDKLKSHGVNINLTTLSDIVETNDKKRFEFDQYKTKIRASQGHSTSDVEIEYEKLTPPDVLYHGTSTDHLNKIMKSGGLSKMKRHHVHLSQNIDTAKSVGKRYGTPVIIEIDAKAMHNDGYSFYKSANNVWLTDTVSCDYFLNTHYL